MENIHILGVDLAKRTFAICVNAIQKCHRLRKAEVSPRALTGVQPDRAETSDIGALAGCAGLSFCTLAGVVRIHF